MLLVPHLVIPGTGDKFLRFREEVDVLVPNGDPKVQPVVANLAEVDRYRVGRVRGPFPSTILFHP